MGRSDRIRIKSFLTYFDNINEFYYSVWPSVTSNKKPYQIGR